MPLVGEPDGGERVAVGTEGQTAGLASDHETWIESNASSSSVGTTDFVTTDFSPLLKAMNKKK